MKKIFTFCVSLLAALSVFAYDFQSGDLFYNITSSSAPYTVEVTQQTQDYYGNYSGVDTIVIPETVTYNAIIYSVTSIGESAFHHCSNLTSITIPNSVTSIGGSAFDECSVLTSVTIGSGVTSIGWGAFFGCSGLVNTNYTGDLEGWCNIKFGGFHANPMGYSQGFRINNEEIKDLVIPTTVDSIHAFAFDGCSSLTSVTIGNSVTSIEDWAFTECSLLETIYVEAATPPTLMGDVFTGAPVSLCNIPCGTLAAYQASDWASQVGEFIEEGCIDPTWQITYTSTDGNIVTPHDTTGFGANIVSNTYENGVGTITFDGPVTSIGYRAFRDCFSLISITIPNSVTGIGEWAFDGCDKLTSITIPNSVTSIGEWAFHGCDKLTSITIPNSVTSIGEMAFASCDKLTSIVVESGNIIYDSRENCDAIIETATNTLIAGCKKTIIPNSVTSIGEGAFCWCTSLSTITIPNSVTSIGGRAFEGCSSLSTITIPNCVMSIGYWAFNGCPSLDTIHLEATTPPALGYNKVFTSSPICVIPCGTLAEYEISEWKNYVEAFVFDDTCEDKWCGDNLYWKYRNGVLTLIGTGDMYDYASDIDVPWYDVYDKITSINIPNGVSKIGNNAFASCISLDEIYVEAAMPPALGDNALPSSSICLTPCGTLAVYEASDWANQVGSFEEFCPAVVKAKVPASWEDDDITVWVWTDGAGTEYPTTKDGDWYVYTHSVAEEFNIIFKSGTGWQGDTYQTVDINGIKKNTCLEIQPTTGKATYTIVDCEMMVDTTEYFITYTSTNDSIVTPKDVNVFGANIVSNTYENGVGTITFDGPVTSIGYRAFYECSALTSITIPSSVKSIENYAFYNCYGLTLINIPNSVTSIGSSAFYSCFSLTSITIPNSVTSIENNAFSYCSSLTSVTFGSGVTSIGNYAFEYCYGLTSITIPNSVTTIGSGAFSYCSGLTSIVVDGGNTTYDSRENCNTIIETATNTLITGCQNTIIPNSVTSIGKWAFSYCSGLTFITIPNSVTSIGEWAFYGCSGLTFITIPNSVTSIGERAFCNCSGLTSIVVDVENTTYDSRENCNAIIETATNTIITVCQNTIIPNSVTSIGNYAFERCYDLTSITLPNSVISIGNYAFLGCDGLTSITIPNSVTSIGGGAFEGCSRLNSINIPNSVTSIGNYAFEYCSWLDTIHIEAITPPTLGGTDAFTSTPVCVIPCGTLAAYEVSDWASQVGSFVEECVEGQQITYTSTNDSIVTPYDVNAFDANIVSNVYENGVGTITFDGPVTTIGYYAFHNCDSLISIIIPNSVKNIGYGAFSGCVSLESITIGSGVTTIGEDVFGGCGMLTSIEVDANNVTFDSREDCNAIIKTANNILVAGCKTTVIPSGIKGIGNNAFAGNWDLTSIEIPDGVETIGSSAFGGCTLLRSVTLPNTLTTIGNDAFSTCPALTSITIPSSVKKIDDDAFWCDYALDTIYVEATTPPTLGYNVFYYVSVSHCFIPCGTLAAYEASDWASQVGSFEEDCVEGQQIYYTSTDGNIVTPNDVNVFGANIVSNTYENGVGTITFDGPVTSIGDSAFHECKSLASITIPNSVTSIGDGAFAWCYSLTSITIPNSVTSIGSWAFRYCTSLTSMTVENGNTVYDSRENCNAIIETATNTLIAGCQNTIIPNSVTSIGDRAFFGCSSLTSITIPNSVTSIGFHAFSGCSSLTSITIPNGVRRIGDFVFKDCSSLASMVVESGNTTYDSRDNCNAIIETATNTLIAGCQNTIVPNSVTSIGDGAFRGHSSLTSITIPNSVTSIGNGAFFYCSSLDTIYLEATTPPTLVGGVFKATPSPTCIIPCGTLAAYQASDWANYMGEFVEDCVEGQQIYYTSTDGNIVTPNATDVFGANIVSNTYENGQGVITFDGPVTSIGDRAFFGCSGLTSITISNSVTSIGEGAFSTCSGLTSITIPNSVTSFGDVAFYGCSGLTSITIPNSVKSIGRWAFSNCSGLTSIVVDGENTTYDSRENCNAIIETATNTLITGCQNTIIPNSVTSIGDNAFYYCFSLTSITIPNSVMSIGDNAFYGCDGLTSITIPNSVTSIEYYAFSSCDGLTSITIPNSVTSIGESAFSYCSSLTSIVVDGENTTYDSRENCNAIIETATNTLITGCQNTIIPNSVMSIGEYAFFGCSGLTSITISNSVTSIGNDAFYGCSSLDTIHIEAITPPTLGTNAFTSSPTCYIPCSTLDAYQSSDWAQYVSEFVEEGCAPIQMCGDDLYWEYADGLLTITGTGEMYDYADGANVPWYDVRGNIKTVSLPDAMTKIGDYAFYKCTEVTSINMPTTLTAIGEKAFAQDTKLACEIILPASMTTIASRAFFNCQAVTAFHIEATTPPTIPNDAFERTTAPIHVPCGYGHIYGKHAQWGVLNLEMCELLHDNVYYYPIDGHTARAVTYHSNPTDTIVLPSAVVIDGMPRTVTEVAASAFADCKDIPAIIFNEGLEYIGERAFVRCYGLQGTILLPATLETIGERAFSYCDNVEKYLIQAMTPPALGANAFTGDNKNALFYISCEAMDDYKVATNWSSLKSRLRDACLNIYHYNTPLGANGVYTTEDTLVASIYYRRQFTPYRWETLYLPFEVDRVTVLEDGEEYDLKAWDIKDGGHYFIAKPDGWLNMEIIFGFTDELDAHTPYIIQFKDDYYRDKIITFYGKESWNKLSTSFEVLSSSSWMQIAGNTTLQDQLLEKPVYMLRSGLDFILQKTTTTLHPFECYVMPYATPSGTPARMNVRFRGDVPTAVESVKGNESHLTYTVDGYTLTVYPQGQAFSIYSLNGALIYSCEAGKEAVDCELNSGCYLLHAGAEAHKIML